MQIWKRWHANSYYSGLNYDDQEGKNASLKGKFQPDRKLLIEDIQKLLEE